MNYCIKCGSKLESGSNFCSSCGAKIGDISKVEIKKEPKKNTDNTKVILMLGIFLVLFSTFILGIITWKSLNEIFRISFFGFETILFFALSFVLKKIDSKIDRLFFVIGLLLIPYTLTLLPYYGLLTDYFNQGPGMYVYLAILYFLTSVFYLLVNNSFKSKFVNYLFMISLLLSFINIGLFFNSGHSVIALLIILYMVVLYIMSLFDLFSESFIKTIKIFTTIMIGAIVPYLLFTYCFINSDLDKVFNIASLIIYIFFGYLKLHKDNKISLEIILPITYTIVVSVLIFRLFYMNEELFMYVLSGICILLSVISVLFNKKLFSLLTSIFTYVTICFLLLITLVIDNNMVVIILSIFLLIYNIFNIISKNVSIAPYFIPLNIFILVLGVINEFFEVKFIYVLLVTIFIFLIIYSVLKICKNKYALTYYVTSFVLSIISTYNINSFLSELYSNNMYGSRYSFDYINIGIIVAFSLLFILSYLFKEQKPFSIISFIFLNISAISIINNFYYGILITSGITLFGCILLSRFKKLDLKPYFIYIQIALFIVTLTSRFSYPIYVLLINILLYVIAYITILKINNVKGWRIAYIIVGLLALYKILGVIFTVSTIASLISVILTGIILVILYLLDAEDNLVLTFISLVILIPYYDVVAAEISFLEELYILPFVIYTFVFTEVIKFKDETNRKLSTIIPISILSIFMLGFSKDIPSIIFDVIYSLFLIFLGLYRKYTYFIYFGIVMIILTIFIQLFTILDSVAAVISLILIGFILIGIAVYLEVKKNNKQ